MEFPREVAEQIGYYVYTLAAPDSSVPFYVGKGTGNRVFAHASAAIDSPISNDKLNMIRGILSAGHEFKYQIVRHGLTPDQALEIEATLIDLFGLESLTNRAAGYNMSSRGIMTANEIIAQYASRPVTISEPALLIIINRLFSRNMGEAGLYEATRGDWVLGKDRDIAKYAFAVYHGVVRQVYRIHSWESVTAKGNVKNKNRWKFTGEVAPEMGHYVNGKVSSYIRKDTQSPALYLNCKKKKDEP